MVGKSPQSEGPDDDPDQDEANDRRDVEACERGDDDARRAEDHQGIGKTGSGGGKGRYHALVLTTALAGCHAASFISVLRFHCKGA